MPTAPDIDQVKADYLDPSHTFTDEEIQFALDSETLAQARVCRIPADPDPLVPQPYPADLATALCRRVVRAINMKRNPLGYQLGIDGGISYIGARDSEIQRLEAPYRKWAIR